MLTTFIATDQNPDMHKTTKTAWNSNRCNTLKEKESWWPLPWPNKKNDFLWPPHRRPRMTNYEQICSKIENDDSTEMKSCWGGEDLRELKVCDDQEGICVSNLWSEGHWLRFYSAELLEYLAIRVLCCKDWTRDHSIGDWLSSLDQSLPSCKSGIFVTSKNLLPQLDQ